MFKKFKRLYTYTKIKAKNDYCNYEKHDTRKVIIPQSLEVIYKELEDRFSGCSDFVTREIHLGKNKSVSILIAFIEGLVNKQLINSDILRPIMIEFDAMDIIHDWKDSKTLSVLEEKLICSCDIKRICSFDESIDAMLSGDTLIYANGCDMALVVGHRKYDKRSVEEPPTDVVVRGPREGFTETLPTNTALLRHKIKSSNLKFETMKIGEQTKTEVCICYIKGIANEELVNEVKERIGKIKTDAILDSGYIEDFIQDVQLCIFPTVGNTEKPDIAAAKILEGRVAILCDGTPFALTVPYLFVEAIQSSEDYYSRSVYSVITRFIRVLAIIITTMLPAYYVAITNFHQDIIPYKLLLTMTASREGIPFSSLTEAIVMVITFELLREAGVRMPRAIGQAVSIVGALVIGDAAVQAGLVSTPMVIVIAITAITSFIISPLAGAFLIIRIVAMLAANVIGILGVLLVSIAFFISMCNIRSFGVNYLSPFTPLSGMDLKDTFVRFPLWAMFTRPKALTWEHGGTAKYRNTHPRKGK